MTRIVVLADTHLPRRGRDLPMDVIRAIERADAAVHLGDFTELSVARQLESLAPLYAVHGNNDPDEIRNRFPLRRDLAVEGKRLALIHGHVGGRSALAAARAVTEADIVLFGHSHSAYRGYESDRLLLNPGSPTDRRRAPHGSYAVLEIGDEVSATIVSLPPA